MAGDILTHIWLSTLEFPRVLRDIKRKRCDMAIDVKIYDLAGRWYFTPDGGRTCTVNVPEALNEQEGFGISGMYEREIVIPDLGIPQVTVIAFEAVNYEATVFINGVQVSNPHIGAFTPFEVDITEHVKPGLKYNLGVYYRGRDCFGNDNEGYTCVNFKPAPGYPAQGIIRGVSIKAYPAIYIKQTFIKTSVERDELEVDLWIVNKTENHHEITIKNSLISWNVVNSKGYKKEWNYPSIPDERVLIAPGEIKKITIGPVKWGLGEESYWWPNVPYDPEYRAQLHILNTRLYDESGCEWYSSNTRFGFRESCSKGSHYYLNGIRVNLRGESLSESSICTDAFSPYASEKNFVAGLQQPGRRGNNKGWPDTVSNLLRLNFNVIRFHGVPAMPYHLDVADELGIMVIDESGIQTEHIRQNAPIENFTCTIKELIERDRNHPSLFKYSLANETRFSDEMKMAIIKTARECDPTRPFSFDHGVDLGSNDDEYHNIANIVHYFEGTGRLSDYVEPCSDRPYGQGEYIWPVDVTDMGLAWLGTSVRNLRFIGASDIRPFALVNAWPSYIEGLSNKKILELGGSEIGGPGGKERPWTDPKIELIRKSFSPVAVFDGDFDEANKYSNFEGDWPVTVPVYLPGQEVVRRIRVFNDEFRGKTLNVRWEVRIGSVDGQVIDFGSVNLDVDFGSVKEYEIHFKAPQVEKPTKVFLVLTVWKYGVERFRENLIYFNIVPPSQLTLPYLSTYEFDPIGMNPSGWIIKEGEWKICNTPIRKRVYNHAITGRGIIITGNKNWGNYSMSAEFLIKGTDAKGGVIIGYKDENNYSVFEFEASKFAFITVNNGKAEMLYTGTYNFYINEWNKVDMYLTDKDDVCVLFNDNKIGHISKDKLIYGCIGLKIDSGEIEFDNINVAEKRISSELPFYDDFRTTAVGAVPMGWRFFPKSGQRRGITMYPRWVVQQHGGIHYIQNEEYYDAAKDLIALNGNTEWRNYSISARLKFSYVRGIFKTPNTYNYCAAGILGRVQDENHYYRFELYCGHSYRLLKVDGDNIEVLGAGEFIYERDKWYHLRINFVGDSIHIFIDGKWKGAFLDTSYRTGGIGLYIGGQGNICAITDVRAEEIKI